MRNIFPLLIILAILIFPSAYGLASSYGEGKIILKPTVPEGKTVTIERSIRVKNVNEIPVIVTLEPSREIEKIITILDKKLILQPDELKRAYFTITLRSGGR